MNSGMKDIVNVMSKFLNLGMPLQEIILKSTWNPAKEIRREKFGHLSVGAPADVAVFRLDRGDFGFVDTDKMLMKGSQRLACEMTPDGRQSDVGPERARQRAVGEEVGRMRECGMRIYRIGFKGAEARSRLKG